MFQLIGPTALRSIASHLVVKAEQGQLFAFISASDGMLQLITSGIDCNHINTVTVYFLNELGY